jgi:signal transduction histidine kinase
MMLMRLALACQATLSFYLAALLWTLYRRLRPRPLYRWWALAWLLGGILELTLAVGLGLTPDQASALSAARLVVSLAGGVAVVCVAIGAQDAGSVIRRWPLELLLPPVGALMVAAWALPEILGLTGELAAVVRNAPRQLLAMLAMVYTASCFRAESRAGGAAARVLVLTFTGSSIAQAGYLVLDGLLLATGSGGSSGVPSVIPVVGTVLVLLDFAWLCGVGVGTVLSVVEDIGRLQAHLVQAQKAETVTRLAGGIAHDFNNLLTSILSSASLLDDELPVGHVGRADVNEIRGAANRAAQLTRRLVDFSATRSDPRSIADVALVLREETAMLRGLLGDVPLRLDVAVEHAPAYIDRQDLEQLLSNLVLQAGQASAAERTPVTVTVALDRGTSPVPGALLSMPAGSYVRIDVADSGPALLTDLAERAGVGRAIAHGIVQQANGQLQMDGDPGRGTTVRVRLRAAPVAPPA